MAKGKNSARNKKSSCRSGWVGVANVDPINRQARSGVTGDLDKSVMASIAVDNISEGTVSKLLAKNYPQLSSELIESMAAAAIRDGVITGRFPHLPKWARDRWKAGWTSPPGS
jgi:hypothetical protein